MKLCCFLYENMWDHMTYRQEVNDDYLDEFEVRIKAPNIKFNYMYA